VAAAKIVQLMLLLARYILAAAKVLQLMLLLLTAFFSIFFSFFS
jgi:hypothetical protein